MTVLPSGASSATPSNDRSGVPGDRARAAAPLSRGEIRQEVAEFARRHERRRHLLPRAFLVGLLAGLTAVVFREAIRLADAGREILLRTCRELGPLGVGISVVASSGAAVLAVWLVRRFAPETSGSGIPHIKAVLHRLRSLRWLRVLVVKFSSGVIGMGGGLVVGREGPTVQMGGAVGQMVGRGLRARPRERQSLVSAGAGAGLAAAFNAPLAGVMFVMEELRRDFAPGTLTSAFVACATGDVVSRYALGQQPVFHVAAPLVPDLTILPLFAILGVFEGLIGVVFNRVLLRSLRLADRFRRHPLVFAGAVGAVVGVVAWFLPRLVGSGGAIAEDTLAGRVALGALVPYFFLRFALTMGSYATGTAGGIFAPLLVLGAQAGLMAGIAGRDVAPGIVADPSAFAILGMAALFTAIVRAPLTAIVLVLEMTGGYALMLPLLVTCFAAYLTADWLRTRPIYEALLERELGRSQEGGSLEGTLLLDLVVEPGAPFAGRRLADLGLPPGVLVVHLERGARTRVPSRDTLLRVNDRLTVVVDPEAVGSLERVQAGVAAPVPGTGGA